MTPSMKTGVPAIRPPAPETLHGLRGGLTRLQDAPPSVAAQLCRLQMPAPRHEKRAAQPRLKRCDRESEGCDLPKATAPSVKPPA